MSSTRRLSKDSQSSGTRAAEVALLLPAGDRFVMETSGGGGVGDPHRRSAAAIAADLRAGKISSVAAAEVYGFVQAGAENS